MSRDLISSRTDGLLRLLELSSRLPLLLCAGRPMLSDAAAFCEPVLAADSCYDCFFKRDKGSIPAVVFFI